jgi:hypothetical protein
VTFVIEISREESLWLNRNHRVACGRLQDWSLVTE